MNHIAFDNLLTERRLQRRMDLLPPQGSADGSL